MSLTFARRVAVLRIAFGVMWAIDASFKWRPAFTDSFLAQVSGAAQGQPAWLQPWFTLWHGLFAHAPHVFAYLTATVETLIAIGLVIGFGRAVGYLAGTAFSVAVWAIPEGFGGPYTAGATDIGTGIVYGVVFLALYGLEAATGRPAFAVDPWFTRRFALWAVVSEPTWLRPKDTAA